MTLTDYIATSGVKPADLARDVGCHRSYIRRVITNERQLSQRAAIRIWNKRSVKLGPLAGATDEDVAALARMLGEAA